MENGAGEVSGMARALEDPRLVEQIKSLFARDGGAEREHNAAEGTLGFGLLHYALVRNLRPARALVVGSRYGYIPSIIALAMQASGSGELDFVDASYDDAVDGFERAYGGVGFWKHGEAAFDAVGVGDLVCLHLMRSEAFFERSHRRYGYVYLDGDHSLEGCRFDLSEALSRLEDGGVVALHDVLVEEPGFGVGRVFGELDPARFRTLLIPIWPGLGLVQVAAGASACR